MSRSYDDLRVAFVAGAAGRKWLAFATCREDAARVLAEAAGVPVMEVSPQRAAEADEWLSRPDLSGRAREAGLVLVPAHEPLRGPTDRVEDEDELRGDALANWPGAEVLSVRQLEGVVQVHMTFDGGRHAFWLPDSGEVLLAPVDRAAWAAFSAGCQSD